MGVVNCVTVCVVLLQYGAVGLELGGTRLERFYKVEKVEGRSKVICKWLEGTQLDGCGWRASNLKLTTDAPMRIECSLAVGRAA